MLIRRSLVEKSKMTVIKGKVISKELTHYYSGYYRKNRHEILLFEIESIHDKIAINFFSENEAKNDTAFSKVDTGKVYQFYLDPSYPSVNSRNSGVSIIDYEGIEVYRKNNSINLYAGIFFVLLGVALTYLGIKYSRPKNGG
jgi:hypothetical protein